MFFFSSLLLCRVITQLQGVGGFGLLGFSILLHASHAKEPLHLPLPQ